MKRYWFGLVLVMLSLSAVWLQGVRSQLGVPTPSSRWVYDAYQFKIAAANAIPGPRVLVVAGSNVMFGIDSAMLETYWHKPVVNLGVNAGLGLPYILSVSQRVARPGDVILMPLEYGLILDYGKINSQVVDYTVARDLDYWRSLPMTQRLQFAAAMSPERWVNGLRHLPDPAVTSGTYGAHHLDARGDQTHSAASDRTPSDIAQVTNAKPRDYGGRKAREQDGAELLAAYRAWATAHNICLVAVPAAFLHHSEYDDAESRKFYDGLPARVRATGIPYLGTPADFMYPLDWFFDTDSHLQDWARERHTARLIKLLAADPAGNCRPAQIQH